MHTNAEVFHANWSKFESESTEDRHQNLFNDSYTAARRLPEDQRFLCADDKEENKVADKTVEDYTKSMETLKQNGGTTSETVDSFKKAVKALKEFDEKALEKELVKGAKDPKVRSLDVLMHLKEVLEKSDFKVISLQPGQENGSVVMKNDKTETYVEMQFSREKGKEGASVKIQDKR